MIFEARSTKSTWTLKGHGIASRPFYYNYVTISPLLKVQGKICGCKILWKRLVDHFPKAFRWGISSCWNICHMWKLSWEIWIDCEWRVLKMWAEKHWKAIQLLQQKVIYHWSCSSPKALESSLSNKLKYNDEETAMTDNSQQGVTFWWIKSVPEPSCDWCMVAFLLLILVSKFTPREDENTKFTRFLWSRV